ncbi:MAG TPA: hypothetical protein VFT99_18340, partial [Roseiflexaceae bacterium]|nr:hypothetical protein [Roseiflexaceae bacterium]
MNIRLPVLQPQPLTACILAGLALMCLAEAAMSSIAAPLMAVQPPELVLATFLFLAIVTTSLYPIHIRHNIKVILTTVPIYVAAMVLAPFPAGLVVCFGIVLSETLSYRMTGNTISDIVTQSSRWTLITILGAALAANFRDLPVPAPLVYAGVALAMLLLDLVTGALEIAPMSRERPGHVLKVLVREATLPEAVQYLIGILAVLAAAQQRWSIVLWVLPLAIVYQSFKYAKEMHDGTRQLLESMADIVDVRDPYTGGHSRRV